MRTSRSVALAAIAVFSALSALAQTNNQYQSTAATCDAPSSPGVNVCSPTSGETVTSPVTFIASGTGASGTVNHLELWIDGTKIGNYDGSTMEASVAEGVGSHTATVVEVDSEGNYVKSTPVTYAVTDGYGQRGQRRREPPGAVD
jgi:hypothetical protein